MKSTNTRKKIIALLIIIISFFILNAFWLVHHYALFGKYEKITKDPSVPGAYISPKDDLTFSVSKIRYLNFGGNLGISDPEKGIYLIIWPHLFKDYEYGFMIMAKNETYNYYIDENGKLLNGDLFSEEALNTFKTNNKEVLFLINEYNQWKLAAEKNDKTFFD
ncbi:MAG: hypothetical protein IJT36_08810 [Alphaproteobacteria bacterium]|nr:hypothetical protein [Alphaproteobacteria bacterium]